MFKWLKREKRLEELEDTCAKLQKSVRDLELEWDSVYEKFRLLNMRISKRVKLMEQAPETETAQPAESGEAPASSLSARQQELNNRILARRQRGGNGGLLHG